MHRFRYIALGLLLAVAGSTFAVVQGGYPSLPFFQAAFFSGLRPSVARCVTASCIELGASPSGAVGGQAAMSNASAPLDSKVWDEYVDNTGCKNYRLINDALGSAYTWMQVCRTGISANPTINFSGQQVLKYAAGQIGVSSSSCAALTQGSGNFGAINIASCVRNGVGDYTISFTSSLVHAAMCLTTPQTNSAIFAPAVSPAGGASTNLKTYTSAGAASDGPYTINLICYGN